MTNNIQLMLFLLVFVCALARADDASEVHQTIERHYAAIHANQLESVMNDHLEDMTMFLPDGAVLWEADWNEVTERLGATPTFGELNVRISSFNTQVYGNVAIATFYLVGTETRDGHVRDLANRVSAIWVKGDDDGVWREAHHHESPLSGSR